MSQIYIIGHKNPDTDSIASAYTYAALKQQLNPENRYIPARCGNVNNQTKYIFQRVNAPLPQLLKDVYPKTRDVMTENVITVKENDPVADVFHHVERSGIRVMPVVDDERRLKGMIGSPELLRLFIQEVLDQRPKYTFMADHIAEVIKGSVIHKGVESEFKAAIMVGAMPMEQTSERLESAGPEETLLVVGKRRDVIEFAISRNVPAIIITGKKPSEVTDIDFSRFKGWVYLSNLDSAETIRRVILASPTHSVMTTDVAPMTTEDYLEDAQIKVMQNELRALPVVEGETLVGIITRSNLVNKHKTKLILMDHNEPSQAVDGIENAEVLEIVDHHRLGAVKTAAPVTYYAKPVGSTCTLVYQLYTAAGKTPDKEIAMLLMGGILSDTVILKSPTTTDEDKKALTELSAIADVDFMEYGLDIFKATDNLSARTPENIVNTDFKAYSEFGVNVGVGQVEVVTLGDLDEVSPSLINELERQKTLQHLDWAMLLVTDIIKEESVLLCTPFEHAEKKLLYRELSPGCFFLPGILSRKKQLLPEILRILEELN
ncbi:MAG: putative manganese-dependent inorganic diphosphatase [Deferribacteraceae bacterium]|jgi:manganese-dependent inorganic pyrophosphatase|nr:putative manganese-dependent inorganic diphosphatase [Deferribacteraceae bacterium]